MLLDMNGVPAGGGRMTRLDFLRATTCAGMAAAFSGIPAWGGGEGKRPPNIIFILADDLGYEGLGCNGSLSCQTPNLDQLAAGGVRFTNAHSMPICTPTRVQAMTGRYNFRNYTKFAELNEGEITFANLLRDRGYATAISGKWQLGGRHESIGKFGFDEYCLWNFMGKGSGYWDPEIWQNGKKLEGLAGKYGPDLHVDFLLDFVERNKEKPFLAYWTTNLPHEPYGPTPDNVEGRSGVKAPPEDPEAGTRKETLPKDGKDYGDPKYFPEMVGYLDKLVGRVVKKLEDLNLRNDTILLFFGDNGSGYGTKIKIDGQEISGGKAATTVYGTHVPLIVQWPASGAKGVVRDDLVDCSDFVPTLVEAAGANLPPDLVVDGRSFLPAVRGEMGKPRDWIFFHYILGKGRPTREWVMDKRWKLYSTGELYDYRADPKEKKPVREGGDAAEARGKLQGVLDRMKAEGGGTGQGKDERGHTGKKGGEGES
jgi:arylsulfatase A